MELPSDHLARIDDYLVLPMGTLEDTDILGPLIDSGKVVYKDAIDYGRFLALLGHEMSNGMLSTEHIYIRPWVLCPPDRVENGYAKVCTFARLGRLLLSTNGRWYLTRPRDHLWVSNGLLLHGNPVAIMVYVETSCYITAEAETEGVEFKPVPPGKSIDLDLPFYRIEFGGSHYDDSEHVIVVRDGMIMQSVWNHKKPFTMPIDGMREAIKEGDYHKVACLDDESDERVRITQHIPVKSAGERE